jgi:hypothetical protein
MRLPHYVLRLVGIVDLPGRDAPADQRRPRRARLLSRRRAYCRRAY